MIGTKGTARFLLVAVSVYLLLMAPWPGSGHVIGSFFRGAGTVVARMLGVGETVFLEPMRSEDPAIDSAIRLFNQPVTRTPIPARTIRIPLTTRYLCLAPLAIFIALLAASPIPWARRWRAFLRGLPLLVVFVVGRIVLMTLTVLIQQEKVATYVVQPFWGGVASLAGLTNPGPSLKRLSAVGADLFCGATATAFLVPVLIWVLVTFEAQDRRRLLGKGGV